MRRGDWLATYSGVRYYPGDPRSSDVRITDIARALSKICRFAGHCDPFYSVAEHSVLVSQAVPERHARQALMHDATEAYLVDIPRPVKTLLGPEYGRLEDLNWAAICGRFLLDPVMHESVKWADNAVLFTERAALFPTNSPKWDWDHAAAAVTVRALSPDAAYDAFLTRFYELFPEA